MKTTHQYLSNNIAKLIPEIPTGTLYAAIFQEVEREMIVATLIATQYNQLKASKLLCLNRGVLRRKIEFYGLLSKNKN